MFCSVEVDSLNQVGTLSLVNFFWLCSNYWFNEHSEHWSMGSCKISMRILCKILLLCLYVLHTWLLLNCGLLMHSILMCDVILKEGKSRENVCWLCSSLRLELIDTEKHPASCSSQLSSVQNYKIYPISKERCSDTIQLIAIEYEN